MVFHEFFLCIDHNLGLVCSIMTTGIRLLVGEEMHKLQFHAQMVHALVDIPGQLHAKRLVETGNVSHDMGLRKHVIIAEESLVRRTV